MNLYSRILELSKITGDTMYSLARHSGVSESVLSRLKSNSQGKLSKKNLILLANYFCVNEDWLESGEGDRDAPGIVRDTLIRDGALHGRFVEIAQYFYGDEPSSEVERSISVDLELMSTYTGIPQDRVWGIICDKQFPFYTEVLQLLKSNKQINANWLFLGVGNMLRETPSAQESKRISALVDTISTLQETINIKSEIIVTLNERIKQLESKLNIK
nr:MAG TPA: repressor protein [Caudoviricetes sp.]